MHVQEAHQAKANCASEQPSSSAMGLRASTFSRLLSISFFSRRPYTRGHLLSRSTVCISAVNCSCLSFDRL